MQLCTEYYITINAVCFTWVNLPPEGRISQLVHDKEMSRNVIFIVIILSTSRSIINRDYSLAISHRQERKNPLWLTRNISITLICIYICKNWKIFTLLSFGRGLHFIFFYDSITKPETEGATTRPKPETAALSISVVILLEENGKCGSLLSWK